MNACSRYRSPLALLAAGAVPEAEAQLLRKHCEHCAACAEYLRVLSALCSEHRTAAQAMRSTPSDVAADVIEFHQRWRQRLRDEIRSAPASAHKRQSRLSEFPWPRFVLALGGAAAAVIAIALAFQGRPDNTPATTEIAANPSRPTADRAPAGNLAERPDSLRSYRLAMNTSVMAFDALLAQNAAQPMPTELGIRAFQRELENGTE